VPSQSHKRSIWSYLIPIGVIGALYALSQVEPEVPRVEIDPPDIELRDRFYGVVANDTLIWAVGKDGKIVRSEDAGKTFVVQSVPVAVNFQDIAMWDPRTAVVVGNAGTVMTTSDGGQTWSQGAIELPVDSSGKLFRVELDPAGRAWTVSELNFIAVSEDKGATWRRVTQEDEDRAWNDIAFAGQRICVAGEFGALRCSDDDGATWHEKPTGLDISLMALEFRDPANGVAVGLNGLIVTTADGGETWTRQPVEGLARHIFDVRWDGQRWVAVGDKGLLLFGAADGTAWEVTRLTETDFAWHTGVTVLSQEAFIASGQSLGVYRSGKWQPLGASLPPG
jgi:photosystem II stability/assembly factor-like uncharacterized protein